MMDWMDCALERNEGACWPRGCLCLFLEPPFSERQVVNGRACCQTGMFVELFRW